MGADGGRLNGRYANPKTSSWGKGASQGAGRLGFAFTPRTLRAATHLNVNAAQRAGETLAS